MNPEMAIGYKSLSQVARKITESWGAEHLYCSSCQSPRIVQTPTNSHAVDFRCLRCSAVYQLKAGKRWDERRVPDAGYEAMMRALRSDSVPNLLVMQYTENWMVQNLLLVPSFFFSSASVEKRPPLGPNARRAGWVGCNILLSNIASVGKIRLVSNGSIVPVEAVRKNYDRIKPLANVRADIRGWTLDVLNIIQKINSTVFDLSTIYSFEEELSVIYPNNNNIRAKIRQQLQILRDLNFVAFEGKGIYRLLH
jgi:type II restriction enzyme